MTPAARCRRNGWAAGTWLRGTKKSRYTSFISTHIVLITAVGEREVFVKSMEFNGHRSSQLEFNWDLDSRRWRRVR